MNALIEDCKRSMKWRGHKSLATRVCSGTQRAWITCQNCGMEAQVIEKPMLNEIEIGGEAVALNCKAQ